MPFGSSVLRVARLELKLYLPPNLPNVPLLFTSAWLDTGAPLSVIPRHVQNRGLRWQALPGIRTNWLGQPCDLGTIDVWLRDRSTMAMCGPFAMLAKFPRRDPPRLIIPVLLGLHFVLTHQGTFQMPPYPASGDLRVL
jgi:hypothetical protein